MRFSSIFTLVCALAAFILSLLCLLAGTSRSFLQSADLLTLNVSRIGQGPVFNTSDSNGSIFDSFVNSLENDLNHLISSAADKVADALNLTDFYSVHVMNYCDGFFEPNATAKGTSKNTTFCSKREVPFHFDPTQIVKESLPSSISIDQIHWPQEIQDATNTVKTASDVMFVFYVIGIAFSGLGIISAIVAVFAEGRLSACGNFLIDILAFFTLGIASAISTAVIIKAVNAINKYGSDIGISATKGSTFLGLTWAATAAALVASIFTITQCIAGRKHGRGGRTYGEKPY